MESWSKSDVFDDLIQYLANQIGSDEIQALGLKKKGEYESPTKKETTPKF